MKLKILVLIFGAMLSGCSYDLDQVEASKSACKAKSGDWQFASNGFSTYCIIDGIRYVYNRDSGNFTSGVFVK